MSVSLGPFITCFITITFLTLYLYIVLYHSGRHYIYSTKAVFIGIAIILLRMCVPVNFPFTHSIYSHKIFLQITKPLYTVIGRSGYMVFHIFLLCWLVTAIFRFFRLCVEKIRLCRYIKEYTVTAPDKYPNIFSSIAGCSTKPINIAVVPHDISPAITGLLHPTLLLPARCESLPQEDLDYICMHEIIHYQNHDLFVKLLMEIVSCIHWWNPFVYLLRREYSLTLELANDFRLINTYSGFNHLDYARLIVETAKSISGSCQDIPGKVISFTGKRETDLSTRIHFILNISSQDKTGNKAVNIHTVMIGFVLIFSLLFVCESSSRTSPIAEDGSFEMPPENTYFIQTSDGYDIYVEDKYMGAILELPENANDYKIIKEGDPAK